MAGPVAAHRLRDPRARSARPVATLVLAVAVLAGCTPDAPAPAPSVAATRAAGVPSASASVAPPGPSSPPAPSPPSVPSPTSGTRTWELAPEGTFRVVAAPPGFVAAARRGDDGWVRVLAGVDCAVEVRATGTPDVPPELDERAASITFSDALVAEAGGRDVTPPADLLVLDRTSSGRGRPPTGTAAVVRDLTVDRPDGPARERLLTRVVVALRYDGVAVQEEHALRLVCAGDVLDEAAWTAVLDQVRVTFAVRAGSADGWEVGTGG